MRADTRLLIDELLHMPWFKNVGQVMDADALFVKSWREAMRHCNTEAWESLQLQTNNVIGLQVNRINYSRFRLWNNVVQEIKTALEPILDDHIRPVAVTNKLPTRFQDSVLWDLLEICVETEYRDIVPPMFFVTNVLPVYKAGHFPCGWDGPKIDESWEGPMPEGKLYVY